MSSAFGCVPELKKCFILRARRCTTVGPRGSSSCPVALRWRIRWALDPSNGVTRSCRQMGPKALGCQHFQRFPLSRYPASCRFHCDEVVLDRRRRGTCLHGLAAADLGGEAFITCGRRFTIMVGLVSIVPFSVQVRGGRSRQMGSAVRPHRLHRRDGVLVGSRPLLGGMRAVSLHSGRLRGRRARR